jgi:uncharacterized Ntn-hydrolase superfamily protein
MKHAGTYSIVAFDKALGQIGAAVQSHWFAVGASILWAEAGVGAVATQSFIEPSYGPSAIDLMKSGKTSSDALNELLARDPLRESRQIAVIDKNGHASTFTGNACVGAAGHITGNSFSVQANMMDNNSVWIAMEKCFSESKGDLADRMLQALEAAELAGGDIRGQQSAAMIVVSSKKSDNFFSDRLFDIRVDDHLKPLTELRRLAAVTRGYHHMNNGDNLCTQGKFIEASVEYSKASKMLEHPSEAHFWQAVALAADGRIDEAKIIFSELFVRQPKWKKMVSRLPAAGILPDDPELLKKIIGFDKDKV